MGTEQNSEVQFIATAPSFALCTVCDQQYPAGTQQCAKCKSPLSAVRRCPVCERVVSAKHTRCVYCSASFLQEDGGHSATSPEQPTAVASGFDPVQKRRAILVSVGVFLIVMFLGMYGTIRKVGNSGPEVAASSYLLHDASLRLQPNANAGSSTTLNAGSIVALTGIAVDPEGHRWYVLRNGGHRDLFLKVTDVAPPKVRLPELGAQMLRAWLASLQNPELVPDADSAVTYFCSQFPDSAHCDELRMMAANQFRLLAQRTSSPDALERARRMYQGVVDAKRPAAADAAKALESLAAPTERATTRRTKILKGPGSKDSGYGSGPEYALVDNAEVHVKVPDLTALGTSGQVRAAIAREIRVNGKVAVPSNAMCILKISEVDSTKRLQAQLTAIEFGGRHYSVSTAPQAVSANGSILVFPLESSLLIGK